MTESLPVARDLILLLVLAGAVVTDLRSRRILNAFTYPALLAGLALAAVAGLRDLASAIGGAALSAAVLWPLCRAGGMGWGDLKLAAAAGALTGPVIASAALVDGALFGGLAATWIVVRRGEFTATLRRALRVPGGVARSMRRGARPALRSAAGATLPYGVAIAAGTVMARWGHWPW